MLGLATVAALVAGFLTVAPASEAQAVNNGPRPCAEPAKLSPNELSNLYGKLKGQGNSARADALICFTVAGSDARLGKELRATLRPVHSGTALTAPAVSWIDGANGRVASSKASSDGRGGWIATLKLTEAMAGKSIRAELSSIEGSLKLNEVRNIPESWDQLCLTDVTIPNKADCFLEAARTEVIPQTLTVQDARFVGAAQTAPYAPASLRGVSIRGDLIVGGTVTSKLWGLKAKSVNYQWLRNGGSIPGARWSGYKLQEADRGQRISVRVTAGSPGQKPITQLSAKSAKVLGKLRAPNPRVVIPAKRIDCPQWNCTAKLQVKATVDAGVKAQYQWYRNGKAIKGATKNTLVLKYKYSKTAKFDVKYTAKVTVSKAGYRTVTQDSTTTSEPWVRLPR